MSANHIAPDTAAEIFLMDRDIGHRVGRPVKPAEAVRRARATVPTRSGG